MCTECNSVLSATRRICISVRSGVNQVTKVVLKSVTREFTDKAADIATKKVQEEEKKKNGK